jgi:hypothetical protein
MAGKEDEMKEGKRKSKGNRGTRGRRREERRMEDGGSRTLARGLG